MERKQLGDEAESALQFFDKANISNSNSNNNQGGDNGVSEDEINRSSLEIGSTNNTKKKEQSTSTAPNEKRPVVSLNAIANALRDGVPRTERKSSLSFFQESSTGRVFVGTAAVDFLVTNQFAQSREEAVEIGIRLQKELRLFQHVSRKYEFKDTELYYVFLNFDSSEYVFKTHRPWFRRFFRLVGFHNQQQQQQQRIPSKKATGVHWEFPFATEADHPRFTVKDSLVIRSKEARNLLQTMNQRDEMEDVDALGVADFHSRNKIRLKKLNASSSSTLSLKSVDDRTCEDSDNKSTSARHRVLSEDIDIEVESVKSEDDDEAKVEEDEIGDMVIEQTGSVEVKVLAKPPNQDINVATKSDKKIADQMADTRHSVHRLFGHLFHDKAYKLSLMGDTRRRDSRIFRIGSSTRSTRPHVTSVPPVRNTKHRAQSPKRFWGKTKMSNPLENIPDPEKTRNLALSARKEEYDRLLSIGKYSHNNLVVSKVAVIIQPIVDIAQLFLRMLRALFNIMTWRDPFLTFWVVLFGSVVVVVLHVFPWRIFLGVIGIVFTGPQNWIIRVINDRRGGGRAANNLDVIVRSRNLRKQATANDDGMFGYFSSFAPDNRPVYDDRLDKSDYKEVAVPYTPLNYRRVYDWPPETAYARVWSCAPPQNDPIAEDRLEANDVEVYDGFHGLSNDDLVSLPSTERETRQQHQKWRKAGDKIVRGVRTAFPTQLRRRPSHDSHRLESVSEM